MIIAKKRLYKHGISHIRTCGGGHCGVAPLNHVSEGPPDLGVGNPLHDGDVLPLLEMVPAGEEAVHEESLEARVVLDVAPHRLEVAGRRDPRAVGQFNGKKIG